MISLYEKILKSKQLDYKVLQLGAHLSSFNRENCFIVYVNIWNNLIQSRIKSSNTCLGLTELNTPMFYTDLSSFDNLCDITFLRDENTQQPYIVISSNLSLTFRKNIANTIENMIETTLKINETERML